jgi:hypothetical protein
VRRINGFRRLGVVTVVPSIPEKHGLVVEPTITVIVYTTMLYMELLTQKESASECA